MPVQRWWGIHFNKTATFLRFYWFHHGKGFPRFSFGYSCCASGISLNLIQLKLISLYKRNLTRYNNTKYKKKTRKREPNKIARDSIRKLAWCVWLSVKNPLHLNDESRDVLWTYCTEAFNTLLNQDYVVTYTWRICLHATTAEKKNNKKIINLLLANHVYDKLKTLDIFFLNKAPKIFCRREIAVIGIIHTLNTLRAWKRKSVQ